MRQTKGAIGNLLNRYKAVLKKCNLLNTFGSLAVASMLVMGGAGIVQANTPSDNGYAIADTTYSAQYDGTDGPANTDKTKAGALTITASTSGVTIGSNASFTGFTTNVSAGGAIKALNGFTIEGGARFERNTAAWAEDSSASAWGGGALYINQYETRQDGPAVVGTSPMQIGSANGPSVVFSQNKATSTNIGNWDGSSRGGVGGAIAIDYAPEVTITNTRFTENEANYGGAIAAWNDGRSAIQSLEEATKSTILTIIGSTFENNTAEQYGGAVAGLAGGYGGASDLNKDRYISAGNTYKFNSAAFAGAFWNQGQASFDGDIFEDNTATTAGGAIYNAPNATLSVKNSDFIENSSEKAGAINNFGGTITEITDSLFNGNEATNSMGGAISNQQGTYDATENATTGTPGKGVIESITGTTFQNNTAHNGGAIFNGESAEIKTIQDSHFYGNSAGNAPQDPTKTASHGGAITNAGTIETVQNTDFLYNSTTGDGGAIANVGKAGHEAAINLDGVTISENHAGQNGGGIYNNAEGNVTFDGDNSITGNTSGTEDAPKADDLYNAGNITVASGNTEVEALTNITTGSITVGGEGSAATLSVTGSWDNTGTMTVDNLGTLAVDNTVLGDRTNIENYAATVNAGGTYRVDNLGATITTDEVTTLKKLLNEDSDGLLNLGATDIDLDLNDTNLFAHGHYIYSSNGPLTGVINDQSLGYTADVANQTVVKGGFQSIHLIGDGNTTLTASTLTLAGTEEGTKLVYSGAINPNDEGVTLGNLRIGEQNNTDAGNVTLGLADKNYKGSLGNVTFTGVEGKEVTLNVVGAGSAEFNVGTLYVGTDSDTKVVVDGATLNTTGFSMATGHGALDETSITNGTFAATDGSMRLTNVDLNRGTITAEAASAETPDATKGNITIAGTLHGQGYVTAQNTLTFDQTEDNATLKTEAADVLYLKGNAIVFNDALDSNEGEINIDASTGTLTTNGAVNVVDDTIKAKSWILNGSLTAGDGSVLRAEQFGEDEGSSTLNQTVALNGTALLVHGDISDTALKAAQDAMADAGNLSGGTYYAGKTLNLGTDGNLHLNATETDATSNAIVFGDGSLLIVDSSVFSAEAADAIFTSTNPASAIVDAGSTLYAVNAQSGDTFTVFGDQINAAEDTGRWSVNNILADTPMLEGSYNENGEVTFKVADPMEQFPGLSEDLAPAVTTLYANRLNDVNANEMGVRFLSRATNDAYLGRTDRRAAAVTIESAARIAFAGAVPQMTKMASDAATNAVVNRLGFANPDNGAKAMNVDGKLVDDKALGLALWIAPLWSNQTGFGMEAGNLDYGYNANLGGISLGADYTWANNIRAGLMFNIGGGYAESAGGDLSETTNSMTFWGVGAYGGWEYNNFAVMADVSYTSTWNSVDQDVDHRMGMGDLEADIQASAISAGLRFEYKLETQYLDLIPHVGARYMSINTWGYDVETNGGTVLEGDGFQQNIWTFPVGITFSKELEMNNDWYFKPSVDFTVIPAAGDIKAKEDVRFTGLPYSTEIETQMMDYFTWQGGVGLEFGNDNMSVGVNYTLQAGQNSTGHGVFGMFRYEF